VAIVFASAFAWMGFARTELTSIGGALLVVATSLITGVALRRILPFDWLLPLVPVSSKGTTVPTINHAGTRVPAAPRPD